MVTYLPTEHPGTRPSVWPALSAPSMSCHRSWSNIQLVGDNLSWAKNLVRYCLVGPIFGQDLSP